MEKGSVPFICYRNPRTGAYFVSVGMMQPGRHRLELKWTPDLRQCLKIERLTQTG